MADLRRMLDPQTVALVGASERERSTGRKLLQNLMATNGRDRVIFPVNPNKKAILNLECFPNISAIPRRIDLAVIVSPAPTVPAVLEECGNIGVGGVLIVSGGFREAGPEGEKLEKDVAEIGKRHALRILGPNSLGLVRPHIGLNATPLKTNPDKGNIAFISQSGAFGRALLDWGMDVHIGFSMFASLGSMIDIDFGDLIDFLGYDPHTRSIMLYIEEEIGNVKKFVSAARGFARNKPIVVLKPPRPNVKMNQALSHTGQMVTHERVYDAVFKRVGVVKVKSAADLFNTAGVLDARHLPKGPRLMIITNAVGVGVMATNALNEIGGRLATCSEENEDKFRASMPPFWKPANPIDAMRDADVERYERILRICLADPGIDGILVIFTAQGAAEPDELARAVVRLAHEAWKPTITTWVGGGGVQEARKIFLENNIPTYATPEEAVRTYFYMYSYERNLEVMYETPSDLPVDQSPPKNNLKTLIRRIAASGRIVLTEEESKRFLINYGIPTTKTYVAHSPEQAVGAASTLGYPLVLKIASPDITYKSDVGGVITGITSEEELRAEYDRLLTRVAENCPEAKIAGITVQKMIEKIDYEVILGAKKDEDFGSVVLFGMGGTSVQIFQDFAVALPPLNQTLARRLMEETKAYRLLKGYRGKKPADLKQLEQIIVSFSNLIIDFPEIAEVDINPIAVTDGRASALDARIVIDKNCINYTSAYPNLIITPYPTKYIMSWRMMDGTEVLLRPIKPEDEPMEHEMLISLSEKTMRERFFQAIKHITHEMHIRFCNIDYDREMAIVAELREGEKRRIIGIGRLIIEPDGKSGEFAVVVQDDFHGKGLGYKLVDMMIGIAQEKALEEVYALVQSDNTRMLSVCRKLGCSIEQLPEKLSRVSLQLN
ncbi:MAG TPA: bifunctional acetate--CoA ligase family protein/GNAT family N-acetyltransferase [Syntrophorhabdales bacterium]|nr:bifunctional acetate--CoA ligase family protein/GNAT family N-acetyltransferase [Syntrophorhabdales bacterium]